jgi:hypothetical protein
MMSPNEASLIAFAKEALRSSWEGFEVDSHVLQDMARRHGLIADEPYDPEAHGENDVDAEPGDPWMVFAGPLAA